MTKPSLKWVILRSSYFTGEGSGHPRRCSALLDWALLTGVTRPHVMGGLPGGAGGSPCLQSSCSGFPTGERQTRIHVEVSQRREVTGPEGPAGTPLSPRGWVQPGAPRPAEALEAEGGAGAHILCPHTFTFFFGTESSLAPTAPCLSLRAGPEAESPEGLLCRWRGGA